MEKGKSGPEKENLEMEKGKSGPEKAAVCMDCRPWPAQLISQKWIFGKTRCNCAKVWTLCKRSGTAAHNLVVWSLTAVSTCTLQLGENCANVCSCAHSAVSLWRGSRGRAARDRNDWSVLSQKFRRGEIWPLCLLSTADGTFARNRANYCLQPSPFELFMQRRYLPQPSSNMRAAPCDSGSRRRPSNLGGVKLTRGPGEERGGGSGR